MSTSNERADLLFKASLGFPSTNKTAEFFLESVRSNNYILGEEILIDNIVENNLRAILNFDMVVVTF